MRLILIVVLFSIQYGHSQTSLYKEFDFAVSGQSIPETLEKLSAETGVEIAFSSSFFDVNNKISFSVKKEKLDLILNQILEGRKIGFKESEGRILLYRLKAKKHTISGYIEEEKTGERLIAANVFCASLGMGTSTNEYGFFSLTLPKGKHEIVYSYLGCQENKKAVDLSKNISEIIVLKNDNFLAEIVVTPDSLENPYFISKENNAYNLSGKLINATPSLGGEADPVRSATLLPGVQSGVDGLGGLQVRGSDNGQNLMLLDGVPVYIPYHLLGAFSIYNSSTIQSAKLMTGRFPARYGGSASSIFDIRTRDGNLYKWQGEGQTSLSTAKVLIEGPIKKEKGSILLAARTTPSGFLLNPVLNRTFFNSSEELESIFYDVNAKVNYKFGQKDRLYLSFYKGGDNMESFIEELDSEGTEEEELNISWGNTISSLRWNHLFGEKLFANLTLTYSLFEFNYSTLSEVYSETDSLIREEFDFYDARSRNADKGVKIDFDYLPNPQHSFRFGAGLSDREFVPNITFYNEAFEEIDDDINTINEFEELIDTVSYAAREAFIYVEDKLVLGEKWNLNLGLRASTFQTEDASYTNLEPRISLDYKINSKWEWSVSSSRMVQYLHLIANSALRLPTDIWLPSSISVKPQTSFLTETSIRVKVNEELNISLSAYYKSMRSLYTLREDATATELTEEEDFGNLLLEGDGISSGIEILGDYHTEKNGFIGSYTLSKSERIIDSLNQGKPFPFDYDSRHQIKLFFYQKLGKKFQVGLNWIYYSPPPQINIIHSDNSENFVNIDLNEPGMKNGVRSSSYHRLDIEMTYNLKGRKTEQQFKLGAYNLYNQKNTAFFDTQEIEEGIYSSEKVQAFPLLPSFSYRIRF